MTHNDPDREDVEFSSRDQLCRAWLYRPAADLTDPDRRVPLIILGHGLGAVRTMRLDAYAERFRDAGYACLVFDYRHFGDSDGRPRQLLDIAEQRQDWDAAIAYGRTVDGVDPERIILWGSSFGGGHVIVAGARNPDVAAVIAQCPFTDGPASTLAMHPLAALKVTAAAIVDLIGAKRGRAPKLVDLAGPPGSRALMTAPDAYPGYTALWSADDPPADQVAARVGLAIPFDRPGRAARKLHCPAFFAVCLDDSVAPAKTTLRHVAKAPHGEVRGYPYGHFDIYLGEPFEHVVADQLDFLRRTVPV